MSMPNSTSPTRPWSMSGRMEPCQSMVRRSCVRVSSSAWKFTSEWPSRSSRENSFWLAVRLSGAMSTSTQ